MSYKKSAKLFKKTQKVRKVNLQGARGGIRL